jgi:glycosyltransferase involved in cell wall biosynthesis
MKGDHAAEFAATILIPVYFRELSVGKVQLLRRALESVWDQRFPGPFEVLIVDDGSQTPVSECAGALGIVGRDARWVRRPRNGGVTTTLNTGLKAARHPFVARLDADDSWCATKVEKQFALFAADPDLSITATGMTLVTEAGERLSDHIRPASWSGILKFFVENGCPFPHGSVIARRNIYRVLGGYPEESTFAHCEDYALWGIWLRFFKPQMIEEILYRYTVSETAVSGLHSEQQMRATAIVRESFAELNLAVHLPTSMTAFAGALGRSLIEAGIIAYRMWRFGICTRLPVEAIAPLRLILCDRDLEILPAWVSARTVEQVLGNYTADGGSDMDVPVLARSVAGKAHNESRPQRISS